MIGEMNAADVEGFLRAENVGRIGCHSEGVTYVVPVSYVYEGGCVYGHAGDGRKILMMRENPKVCFEVDRVRAINDWHSVIAWGRYEELVGEEGIDAMEVLMKGLVPTPAIRAEHPSYPVRTARDRDSRSEGISIVVYRIRLTKSGGRFETP